MSGGQEQREVPHIVDLPLPSDCEYPEVIWHRYVEGERAGDLPGAVVRPTRLRKRLRVIDLGKMWRARAITVQSYGGPKAADHLDALQIGEAVERAYGELWWRLKRVDDRRAVSEAHAKELAKGEHVICLRNLEGSDLPACFVRMHLEWVRLPVAVWVDDEGRCW